MAGGGSAWRGRGHRHTHPFLSVASDLADGGGGLAQQATEGGFTREVISHWAYLTERFFGRAALEDSWVGYPEGDGAETHIHATLRIGPLPVSVVGSIGGVGKDQVEYTIWGSAALCRITDWHQFSVSDGGDWELGHTDITNLGPKDHARQLSNAAAAVAGESHSMPDFADALSVQVLVEGMLSD